jgi:hypothetical protein
MKTFVEAEKTAKKRVKAWLGTLIYRCAQGQVNRNIFKQRLQSAIDPVVNLELIQQATDGVYSEIASQNGKSHLKGKLLAKWKSKKAEMYLLLVQEMFESGVLKENGKESLTLGELVATWATLTNQDLDEFARKVYPKLNILVKKWQLKTGCYGLTDDDCFQHPRGAAIFFKIFYRILINETPEVNLFNALDNGFHLLKEKPTAKSLVTIRKLFGKVSDFITWRTIRLINTVLLVNPEAKSRLTAPEVASLTEWEEDKQGWGGDVNKASKILQNSLSPELEESGNQLGEASIIHLLESVGKRSLLSNLIDALKGQLRLRFVNAFKGLLEKTATRVVSYWEFQASSFTEQSGRSIRQWLFRR